MILKPREIELIENSWDFILLHPNESGEFFYTRLFEIAPEVRHLFGQDVTRQSEKLISMITFVVHKLHHMEDVLADVKALGQRHAGYHVRREHYDHVGAALMHTLGESLGALWDEETQKAWASAYKILADTMTSAAEHGSSAS